MKTYKDVYKLPLKFSDNDYTSRVVDQDDNFVFQFTFKNEETRAILLDVINGVKTLKTKELVFFNENGDIKNNEDNGTIILIRGWGNLTGIGTMNLPIEVAANIQDTFAEFVVEQLNKRD